MEIKTDFLKRLHTKIYLNRIILFIEISLIMTLPIFCTKFLHLQPLFAMFASLLLVYILRELYENLVIYEISIRDLSLPKVTTFVCANTFITTVVYHFIEPSIGHYSIPTAVIISSVVIRILEKQLWKEPHQSEFFVKLSAKLDQVPRGALVFFALLVGITFCAVKNYGLHYFYYSFALAFFIGMIVEESYNLTNLYDQKLTTKNIIPMVIWSAFCATLSAAIAWVMMERFGYSGQPATIVSVIVIKLIQPLGSRKFILGL